jgi:DNA transformation protein
MSDGLIAWVEEALAPVGTVTSRHMMGGHTLYLDNVIFAIVAAEELWFKADTTSDAAWDAIAADRFAPAMKNGEAMAKGGKPLVMNYRRAPSEVYDEADAMIRWADLAVAAGRRRPARRCEEAAAKNRLIRRG